MKYIRLHPFKHDKSDVERKFDLIRGFILFKEYIRMRSNSTNIKDVISNARRDLPQYLKLVKRYPLINMQNLNRIADYFKIQIVMWTKNTARSEPLQTYKTDTKYDINIDFLGKYFNDGNEYDLSNLTLLLDVKVLTETIHNTLQRKLVQAYSWVSALSYGCHYYSVVYVSSIQLKTIYY